MVKNISLPVSIYALGGLGEVGKNMYCIENEETIIIIDAGVRFPGVEFPGIDYIVPDYTHLKNNRNKVKALFITHGHEDHIGGIPFLLQNVNIPVIYAPRLACALIKARLDENKMSSRAKLVEYNSDSTYTVDRFKVSFFRVTHSIPDSFGVCVDTPEGRIVSTGDFKIDLTPVGPDMELTKIARLGDEGVTLLLSDSTNAENDGYTPSERNVYDSINDVVENASGRLIVSTFSSNISRIQQICESGVKNNRKIVIIGRSMEKAVEISRSFGYIKIPDDSIIQTQDIRRYKASEILILCTGSQGESMAALSRIANGEHKDVHIMPGDTVVFSSSAIPGNGIMIQNVVNLLTRCGAEVITNSILSDIHSSGHPAKQELRLMLKLVHPKYFMPMHGEYRMLRIHAELAGSVGVPMENCFILDNGDSITMAYGKVSRGYQVEHGNTYIDGKDITGLADAVIADRRILTEDGMLTIAISVDSKTNELIIPPTFYSKGIINQDNARVMEECRGLVETAIREKLRSKTNFGELKNVIKKIAGDYLYTKTARRPMIIPVIMSKN
ncbi:MAG: ribonuclease J [Erysipelotrichaceae bacterium]|nr:ribonuclease J [Erysipelotrichaceae bacterium]